MEKSIMPILIAAIVGLIGWNIKTTHDLTINVARLEYILQQIAMEN